MPNCRSIPPEKWVYAHKALVYFFTRKGVSNPEDMAQDTLMTLWSREDYQFEKEDDFLKICYGFAKKVLLEGYRVSRKHAAEELDLSSDSPIQSVQGLKGSEVSVFLEEVCRRAETELQQEEWAEIRFAIHRDG